MHSIEIDGSQGEGGGQILRTSLSLSMITGRPVRLTRIRAGRKKPGLKRQHLACVRAAGEISQATVSGDALNSTELSFTPGKAIPGEYHFSIGTAGSTTLLAQTVLPVLMLAESPSKLVFEGGTHNGMAPSYDFFRDSFLPVIEAIGVHCKTNLQRAGFYPVGGGRWELLVQPGGGLSKLVCTDVRPVKLSATASRLNLPGHICERELQRLGRLMNIANAARKHQTLDGPGQGNMLSLQVRKGESINCFDALGEIGLTAEKLARKVAKMAQAFYTSKASVNEYLADQLLMPMALAGEGVFTTDTLSLHTRTNIDVIERFLDGRFDVSEDQGCFRISYRSA